MYPACEADVRSSEAVSGRRRSAGFGPRSAWCDAPAAPLRRDACRVPRMDDALVARWRAGDAKASTAVRNAIRSTAERVLSHPALDGAVGPQAAAELEDDDRRRDVTARLAQDVMRRKASNAAQVKALAIMAASRHAVEAMQSAWPKTDGAPPATGHGLDGALCWSGAAGPGGSGTSSRDLQALCRRHPYRRPDRADPGGDGRRYAQGRPGRRGGPCG